MFDGCMQQVPVHLRSEAADAMYYEAQCRIEEPVYGCVGIISLLHQQICDAQRELAKAQAQIAFLNAVDIHQHHYDDQQDQAVEAIPIFNLTNMPFSSDKEFALEAPYDQSVTSWFC